MANSLLQTLMLIQDLGVVKPEYNRTDSLCAQYDISERTLHRYIEEARHLGADIEAVKCGKVWCWKLNNWDDIKQRVKVWYRLEELRDLRGGTDQLELGL